VGRSKDVIIDSNGKNVYPDRSRSLPQLTLHQGVVGGGLPDGVAEHVACAVVPILDHDPGLSRAEVQAKIESHFREVATGLPFWKRVRTLEFWRGAAAHQFAQDQEARRGRRTDPSSPEEQGRKPADHGGTGLRGGRGWFLEIVPTPAGKAPYEIRMHSRVDELGFDSLTFTEFAAALEAAGVHVPEGVVFMVRSMWPRSTTGHGQAAQPGLGKARAAPTRHFPAPPGR